MVNPNQSWKAQFHPKCENFGQFTPWGQVGKNYDCSSCFEFVNLFIRNFDTSKLLTTIMGAPIAHINYNFLLIEKMSNLVTVGADGPEIKN